MKNVDGYPTHDRTGCQEHNPAYNAEAAGSQGCARCTALIMDQRDELISMMKKMIAGPKKYPGVRRNAIALIGRCDPSLNEKKEL